VTKQTNGWQHETLKASRNQRINRAKQAAKLKRERVAGSEYTPAELVALHEQLKADYYARESATLRAAA
jgi:hypothetical protein